MQRLATSLCAEVSTDKKHYVAHNKNYDQILVPLQEELMGKMFDVEIVDVGKFHMIGKVLQESVALAPERPPTLGPGGVSSGKVPDQAVLRERRARRAASKKQLQEGAEQLELGAGVQEGVEIEAAKVAVQETRYEYYIILAVLAVLLLDLLRAAWRFYGPSSQSLTSEEL